MVLGALVGTAQGRLCPPYEVALLAGLALVPAAPASAQGKLDARYEVTLAGIPVGKGSWVVDIADDQYSASASGGTSGLLKAFASGSGTGGSQGRIVNGALVPQAYSATVHVEKIRNHPDVAGRRQHQGIRHRAGAAGRSRPHPRSPTRIAAACSIR